MSDFYRWPIKWQLRHWIFYKSQFCLKILFFLIYGASDITGGRPAGAQMTSYAVEWRHDVRFSWKFQDFLVNIFLLWKFQVECMFQNENIVPKLTGGQTDRCQNDVTVCHMTLWRQILIKVSGNIFLPNILLLWKFQGDCTIRSEIMVVFIFSQNRKYAESCTPAEETPPVISVVYHRWSWNFHRMRRIDEN